MNEDLARADAFERRMLERLSTETVPFHGGVAYLDTDFPLRYDSNLLWVLDAGAVPVERWVGHADQILGSREYRHRKVLVQDQDAAARLEMGFVEHGYAVDRGIVLAFRGEPDRTRDLAQIEEVSLKEARPLIEKANLRQPWATDEETVRQLTDYEGKLEEVIGTRFFMARVDGEPAGCCELYQQDDQAQIEAVDTLEEYRGRGLASAFVLAAVDAARKAGANWIFLWADADGWPQQWYRRLGFEEVARAVDFTRWAPGEAEAMAASKSPGTQ